MSDQSIVTGNENIVIQGVSDSTITLNVNGETKEIKNDLAEMKALMEQLSMQSFQIKQQVYNIQELNEANFGFVMEKKAFNEALTESLMEGLQPHNKKAAAILEEIKKRSENWVSQPELSDRVKDFIARSYVGVVGNQLRKLIAIGKDKEEALPVRQDKYITNCYVTAKRTVQLLVFALVSKLWDHQTANKIDIQGNDRDALVDFFEAKFEPDLLRLVQQLKNLMDMYQTHNLMLPLPELSDFNQHLEENSVLMSACNKLQEIRGQLDNAKVSMLTCFECEKHLIAFLRTLSFLAEYRMISIKDITYNETRNQPPRFMHKFASLQVIGSSTAKSKTKGQGKGNTEHVKFDEDPIITDGILLFKGQYKESTNLFPFIIDFNSLTEEAGARICFFSSRHTERSLVLQYVFLDDNGLENIEFRNTLKDQKMAEVMMDPEERVSYKLDTVYSQFVSCKNDILGGAVQDPSNLFEEEEETF